MVVANIYGHSVEEYGDVAGALRGVDGVHALEVNVSCPNVALGGMAFGTDPDASARVTEAVLARSDKPVIVKLSPNVTDIREPARAVESAGAHAVSLINTITGMVVDVERRTPVLGNVTGGLSGPAIRPVAVRMVYEVAGALSIPVIGGRGNRQRPGRPGVPDHRGAGRGGGNRELRGSDGPDEDRGPDRGLLPGSGGGSGGGPDRDPADRPEEPLTVALKARQIPPFTMR